MAPGCVRNLPGPALPGRGECDIITGKIGSRPGSENMALLRENGHITVAAGRTALTGQNVRKPKRGLSHETFTELKAHIQKG